MLLELAVALAGLAVLVGILIVFFGSAPLPRRLVLSAWWVTAITGLAAVVVAIASAPTDDWSAARLAPAWAVLLGYPTYTSDGVGPVLNTIYMPLATYAYLPPAALGVATGSPSVVLVSGAAWSILLATLPIVVLTLQAPMTQRYRWAALIWSATFFWCVASAYESVGYAVFRSHADAPGWCGAGLACVLMMTSSSRLPWWRVVLAGLSLGVALGSKQVFAPLALVLPVWFFLRESPWSATVKSTTLGGIALIFVVSVITIAGPQEWWFNAITIPRGHAWLGTFPSNVLGFALEAQQLVVGWLILPLTIFCQYLANRTQTETPLRLPIWTLPVLCCIAQIPLAVLGRVKVGGDVNAYAPIVAFAVLANWSALPWHSLRPGQNLPRLFLGLATLSLLLAFGSMQTTARLAVAADRSAPWSEQASTYLRRSPGTAWFPDHPLAHLAAERNLRHFQYGLVDRSLAGFKPSREFVREAIPDSCQWIVSNSTRWAFLLPYTEDFRTSVPPEGLPRWVVLERERTRETTR